MGSENTFVVLISSLRTQSNSGNLCLLFDISLKFVRIICGWPQKDLIGKKNKLPLAFIITSINSKLWHLSGIVNRTEISNGRPPAFGVDFGPGSGFWLWFRFRVYFDKRK